MCERYQFMVFQGLQGCAIVKALYGKLIGEVVSCGDCFRQKRSGNKGFKHDNTSHVNQFFVFPFSYTICWGVSGQEV